MSTKHDVLELLSRSPKPLTPSETATRLGLEYERTRKAMQRLAEAGELSTDGTGRYRVPHTHTTDVPDHEPMDTGPRVPMLREAWENPPEPPRYRDRWWDWQ